MAQNKKLRYARNRKIQKYYKAEVKKKINTPQYIMEKLAKKWFLEIQTIENIVYGNWE